MFHRPKRRPPGPAPPELRLLKAVLDEPVADFLDRQRRAAAALREEHERRDEELHRRLGRAPFGG
jgi:hypothetical protein